MLLAVTDCSLYLFPLPRKVEDLQFRVEEESITKGDLEVIPHQNVGSKSEIACGASLV